MMFLWISWHFVAHSFEETDYIWLHSVAICWLFVDYLLIICWLFVDMCCLKEAHVREKYLAALLNLWKETCFGTTFCWILTPWHRRAQRLRDPVSPDKVLWDVIHYANASTASRGSANSRVSQQAIELVSHSQGCDSIINHLYYFIRSLAQRGVLPALYALILLNAPYAPIRSLSSFTSIHSLHCFARSDFYFCRAVKALSGWVAMEDTQSTVSSAIAQMISDSLHSVNHSVNVQFSCLDMPELCPWSLPFVSVCQVHNPMISDIERNKHVLKV